ncbi:DEAD-domain-containing protein [Viridothelium virens]|uniref:ATP-dependent RNA helicase n=1 Tax=Viridothelium virens TaxID=1048519 RepID=A0A6A6HJB5_VIRVR|nr:DEAD-domain-containing protein [Viridothelium virens]
MLGASRRCLASFTRKFSTSIPATRTSHPSPALERTRLITNRNAGFTLSSRKLHNGSRSWQNAAVEAEYRDEVNAQRPPSDQSINEANSGGPITRFDELSSRRLVHDNVVRTVTEEMGLKTMTDVQSLTIEEALKGTDIIAQAKTGTGKTLGFLLPILQNIIKVDPELAQRSRYNRSTAADIRAVVISPTRELAEQIAAEARRLTRNTSVIVQAAVGGTQKSQGLRTMQMQGCHLLVGTPGRLNDIFSDRYAGVEAPKLSALVLDEADRLLDAGFWPEINNFQRLLPDPSEQPRQTMMFSATVPREVVDLVQGTLKPGFKYVKTVSEDDVPTVERVVQHSVAARGFENLLPTLLELAERETKTRNETGERPFKAIVYFGSTAEVDLASSILYELGDGRQHPLAPAKFFSIHAKKTQPQRTAAADQFRATRSAILFSSDVTARGMDFPDVTHVIQVGLPRDRDTYIHRIGRTGRAGKEGEGWLIISDIEAGEVRNKLRGLPIRPNDTLETASIDMTRNAKVTPSVGRILSLIGQSAQRVDRGTKSKAYMAMLGNYQWFPKKQHLIDAMNQWTKFGWGWETPPAMSPNLVNRLGLSRIDGINVGHEDRQSSFRSGSGRGGFGSFDAPSPRGGPRSGGGGYGGSYDRASGPRPGPFERRSRGGYDGGFDGGYNRNSGRGFGRDDNGDGYGGGSGRRFGQDNNQDFGRGPFN